MPIDQPPAGPPSVAPVVVQSAQLPPSPGDAAFSIVSVDPPILQISDRLDAALSTVPGFSLYRRISSLGANPTTQGVSLRDIAGSAASRALVTLDGVPQNDPFGGWVIWTGLPPEEVVSASIVRGAGAGPYGAGALTGAVELAEPATIRGGISGDAEGGDLGYARAAGIGEIDSAPGRLFLNASGERSDGWIPVIEGRGSVDRPLDLSDWSAAERLVSDIGGVDISERVSAYQEQRGAGTLYAGSEAEGAQGSLTLVKQPAPGAPGWRLQGWATGSNLVNTSAAVAAGRNFASLSDDQYATPAVGVGLNAALRGMSEQGEWELGVDARDFNGESRERLYSKGTQNGTRTAGGGEVIAGAYAEGGQTIGRWLVTGGVRLDGWENYDSKLLQTGKTNIISFPADVGGLVPSGRAGVRRELAPWLYARAAVYSSFRPATLNELHRPFQQGNNVTEANPDLVPERLYGAEAGFGGQSLVAWDVDAFANRLANAVENVTIGHGPGVFPNVGFVPAGGILSERENVEAINAYGIEGDGDYRLGERLDLRAGFSWTQARLDGGNQAPQLTGRRPALTPEWVATADAVWSPVAKLSLVGELRYEGARWADDLNTLPIAGGTEVDARAAWRATRDVSAFVAVENLLDTRLQTGRSAIGIVTYDAPRLVRVGLDFRR